MIRRPLIDTSPDAPLKFYGFRVERGGSVYAATSPTFHGRMNRNHEVRIGTLERCGRIWVARSLSGMPFEAKTQADAGKALERWTEGHQ